MLGLFLAGEASFNSKFFEGSSVPLGVGISLPRRGVSTFLFAEGVPFGPESALSVAPPIDTCLALEFAGRGLPEGTPVKAFGLSGTPVAVAWACAQSEGAGLLSTVPLH
jgi:hypothetical protein